MAGQSDAVTDHDLLVRRQLPQDVFEHGRRASAEQPLACFLARDAFRQRLRLVMGRQRRKESLRKLMKLARRDE